MLHTPGLFDFEPAPEAPQGIDAGIDAVEAWFRTQTNMKARFATALRQSLDEVLDGQRTGRFDIKDLEKTEKTYLGTRVEILVRAEFGLGRGARMDYLVVGHELDAKFTINANWSIPREAMGHLCLLIKADDHRSRFSVGLVRIHEHLLNAGRNGDRKRTLSIEGRRGVRWLVPDGTLPENLLLHMSAADRAAIFAASGGRSSGHGGQPRINELLRRVHGRIIDRTAAITVASQLDGPKRMRDARIHLRDDGIIVLGHQDDHPAIADALGLPVPVKGSWVAVRVIERPPADPRRFATIAGRQWVIARPDEPKQPAPQFR